MKRTRERRIKWSVFGPYGGHFTNLREAKQCAKYASMENESEYVSVFNQDDGCYYIDYQNGKLIRDGWTIRR